MMKRLTWAIGCLVAVSVAATVAHASTRQTDLSKAAPGPAPKVLRLSVQKYVGFTPEYVALKKGWLQALLKRYHVTLKSSYFESGVPQVQALLANSLDIGTIGGTPTTALIARKASVDYPYVSDEGVGDEGLLVRNGSGITSLKDLAGKTIGVSFGSSSDLELRAALKQAGLSPSSVKLVNLGEAASVAAWSRHDIDAVYIFVPFLNQILAMGGKLLFTDAQVIKASGGTANDAWDVYAVRKELMTKYPQFMKDFFTVIDRAAKYTNSHKKLIADTMYQQLGVNSPAAAEFQLRGDVLLTAAANRSSAWLGTAGKPGKFASIIDNLGQFLATGGEIPAAPSLSQIRQTLPTTIVSAIR